MKTIAWIYGSSAAGKETFIRALLSNPPKNVIQQLDWQAKDFVCIEESLAYIGQFENDPITLKRGEIIDAVKSIPDSGNTVILIKGQDVDLHSGLVTTLQNEVPNAWHVVIFLDAPMNILFERARKKSWWSVEDEWEGIEGFKKWLIENQLTYLIQLKDFEFFAFDSSDTTYRSAIFPPNI